MIVFEWDYETHNSDGTVKDRAMWWLSGTAITGNDEEHADEIYEQMAAQEVGL